jgi:hypothetical protein
MRVASPLSASSPCASACELVATRAARAPPLAGAAHSNAESPRPRTLASAALGGDGAAAAAAAAALDRHGRGLASTDFLLKHPPVARLDLSDNRLTRLDHLQAHPGLEGQGAAPRAARPPHAGVSLQPSRPQC